MDAIHRLIQLVAFIGGFFASTYGQNLGFTTMIAVGLVVGLISVMVVSVGLNVVRNVIGV